MYGASQAFGQDTRGPCWGCPVANGEEKENRWGCPDLPPPDYEIANPVMSSEEVWGDCPAYYLRSEVPIDLGEKIADGTADHLIDGTTHPIRLVQLASADLESGATASERLPAKVLDLVMIYRAARDDRSEYERKRREGK